MKKKEREQALERHAKELEDRLNRMERDMDGLRKGESRSNGNGLMSTPSLSGGPRADSILHYDVFSTTTQRMAG